MLEFDYSILKGKIVEVFGSQKAFAEALNVSERTLSLKLNNRIYFSQDEMLEAAKLLGVESTGIKALFFTTIIQQY